MFEIGDLVRGKVDGDYTFTNHESTCEVITEIDDDGEFMVKIVNHNTMRSTIGQKYAVLSSRIELIEKHITEKEEELPKREGIFLTDIFKNDFEDVCKGDIGLYSYIENMARSLEKNIDVDLKTILPYDSENKLTCTENEINEILFKLDDIKKISLEMSDLQKENVLKSSKAFFEKSIYKKKSDLQYNKNRYQETARKLKRQLDDITDSRRELDNMSDNSTDKMLDKLGAIDGEKWKLNRVQNDYITFTTKNDVILTHKKSRQGIDLRMNFGKFKVRIHMDSMSAEILTFQDNVLSDEEYYHPHVNNDGEICWGNVNDLVLKAKEEFDYAKLLDAVYVLLTVYNDDSPYQSLAEFCQESEQVQPNGEILEREDADDVQYTHYFCCPVCDNTWDNIFDGDYSDEYQDCGDCGYSTASHDRELY